MIEQEIKKLQVQIGGIERELDQVDAQYTLLEDKVEAKKKELKDLMKQKMIEDMQDVDKYIQTLDEDPRMRWDGFDITFSKEEVAKILMFKAGSGVVDTSAIGGTYKYEIVPTSIGEIITLTDGRREIVIRDLD